MRSAYKLMIVNSGAGDSACGRVHRSAQGEYADAAAAFRSQESAQFRDEAIEPVMMQPVAGIGEFHQPGVLKMSGPAVLDRI